MYFNIIIIIIIIIITHSITKYMLKSERLGCKTEYFASSTYEEAEAMNEELKDIEKITETCIICDGEDTLSNTSELSEILNRLDDYYYV